MSNKDKHLTQAIQSHAAGRLNEAEALYRKILLAQPRNDVALHNLGVIANQVGKHEMAIKLISQSLAINSGNALAHNNLGNALGALGRTNDAIACYHRALQHKPHYPEALHNLGSELSKQCRSEEAITAFHQAIRLNPEFPDAYNALGIALVRQGKIAPAIMAYRRAISLRPNYFQAHNNLGNTFSSIGKLEEAIACYREALRYKPDYVDAFNNMGNALGALERVDEAIAAFRTALTINPNLIESRTSLVTWKQSACDWSDASVDDDAFLACARQHPGRIDPFFLLSQYSTPADQLLCGQHFAKRSAIPKASVFTHIPAPAKRKIRIAYISGNFRQHPNAYLSVGLFEHHDRTRFDVLGYSYGHNDGSDIRKRVEKSFDRFTDMQKLTHAEAAQQIRTDGIDILIDRQGYTTGHRLGILAFRPAPIQVNYLGYPGTMGADCLDYIIADPFVAPMDQQPFFSEKLVHLPDCYQSTDNRQEIAEHTPSRTECGLPEQGFVFCCFNNTNKIRPAMFDIWMRLLEAVPGSVLWLLNKNKLVQENIRRETAQHGVDPLRVICAPPVGHAEHLARHHQADLFLDTLPFNAHTTASDALWAGLPVVTCAGNTFAGRVAGSILSTIGLPELITHSLEEYEALALKLATHPAMLAKIKQKLAKNRLTTPLFDTARYTRHIEAAYTRMWDIWQSREKPQHIIVESTVEKKPKKKQVKRTA